MTHSHNTNTLSSLENGVAENRFVPRRILHSIKKLYKCFFSFTNVLILVLCFQIADITKSYPINEEEIEGKIFNEMERDEIFLLKPRSRHGKGKLEWKRGMQKMKKAPCPFLVQNCDKGTY